MAAQHTSRPIVVGIDGSESALEATRWAAQEAIRRTASLRLVTAFGWTSTVHPGHPGLGVDDYRELLTASCQEQLDIAAATAKRAAPGVEIDTEIDVGFPVPVLTDESTTARMVVLGSRGLGGFSGLLVGSVAVALSSRASCPVVVVRGWTTDRPGPEVAPVVVGIDGSAGSEAAVAFAFEAASSRGAPLIAVHVWLDFLIESTMLPQLDWDAIASEERLVLAEGLAGWSQKYPDVEVSRLISRDRPARTLVEQSSEAQLVVVGSRGRGGFRGLLLGSVSHAVLHHSQCPVAIVRPDQGGGH